MKITGKHTTHVEVEISPRQLMELLEAEITKRLNETYAAAGEPPEKKSSHHTFHRFDSFYVKRKQGTLDHVMGYCIEGRHPREIEQEQVMRYAQSSVIKVLEGLEEIKKLIVH